MMTALRIPHLLDLALAQFHDRVTGLDRQVLGPEGTQEATLQDVSKLFSLSGKVVIVTGASSGLGVAFADAIAGAGASVVLAARRGTELEAQAALLAAQGATVAATVCDIANPVACENLVGFAMEHFGRLDGLVNNAGVASAGPATRETPDGFRRVIDINLNGTFWMAQATAAVMQPGSSIVNISSVLGLIAPRFPSASYTASKAGVIGLTRDLAHQWSHRKGIRVNALCPGYFATDMTADGQAELLENVQRNSMLQRFGEPDELTPAAVYLLSDASSYVTGTTLVVDGGMHQL
jgi:NAD(P)-dependent dehydrogenase (short-subunit alcohol dehydrogenase family)